MGGGDLHVHGMIRQLPNYSISLIQQYLPNTVSGMCSSDQLNNIPHCKNLTVSGDAALCHSPHEGLAVGGRPGLQLKDLKGTGGSHGWGGKSFPKAQR